MTYQVHTSHRRFLLSGHSTFSNRGCEAIVRSTAALLREQFPGAEILVPSSDIARDRSQWPDAANSGVIFVPAYRPWFARYWVHAHRLRVTFPKRCKWPFPLPRKIRKEIERADLVLSVGGDNYSLDYQLPLLQLGLDKAAMQVGKPVVLWGASVGPFEAEPAFLPVIRRHLENMRLIAARESATVEYLRGLGLSNVVQVADPAFALAPQEVDVTNFWPRESAGGVLGFNASSLIELYRKRTKGGANLIDELAQFVLDAVAEMGCSVLLVPHVVPPDGAKKNNDAFYLGQLLSKVRTINGRVRMMDHRLNAAQIKYVISKCRFFIGARTHATIAALSSGVPTVSIAYSIKAKGINKDLFGHTEYVLETPSVTKKSLITALGRLMDNETTIKAHLQATIPLWRRRAADGAKKLMEILE